MRYLEIISETTNVNSLTVELSRLIPIFVKKHVQSLIRNWQIQYTADRREKLGYKKYDHYKEGKPFDEEAFEKQNERDDWSFSNDIGDNIDKLFPTSGHSPLWGAMRFVEKEISTILQKYVRSEFGDPVYLQHGKVKRNVEDIQVVIWHEKSHLGNDHPEYGGIYRSSCPFGPNKTGTRLEVIVDKNLWKDLLEEAVVSEVSGGRFEYDGFAESIMRILMHEYAHLLQDIKGQKDYTKSIIPTKKDGKTSRDSGNSYDPDDEESMYRYYARPAEIDAMAVGAAARMVDRIARNFEIHARTYNILPYGKEWSIDDVPKEDWNEQIKDGLSYDIANSIEFEKYVECMNSKMIHVDNTIKNKFLIRVKNRFLKKVYQQLSSYLRK